MWFQVHYPPLIGVLPIFRSRYLVRSLLLTDCLLLSFPRVSDIFHFPPFSLHAYGFSMQSFGHPGINTRLTIPPGFSQSSTPFIASWRQDIPHTPLVAWPHWSHPRRAVPHEERPFVKPPSRAALRTGGVTIPLSSLRALLQRLTRNANPRRLAPPGVAVLVRQ